VASIEFVTQRQPSYDLVTQSAQSTSQVIHRHDVERFARRWVNVHPYLDDLVGQGQDPQIPVGHVPVAGLLQASEQEVDPVRG
jgi:hypothetical protein